MNNIDKAIFHYFDVIEDDFLDIVRTIIKRIDNWEDYDEVYDAINDSLIYYSDEWTIMKHYQTPDRANLSEAIDELCNDITCLCEIINKGG